MTYYTTIIVGEYIDLLVLFIAAQKHLINLHQLKKTGKNKYPQCTKAIIIITCHDATGCDTTALFRKGRMKVMKLLPSFHKRYFLKFKALKVFN